MNNDITTDPRQEILRSALETFNSVGFTRATVEQMRKAAGVSNGSFFHFFKSKETLAAALFLEALGSYHDAMVVGLKPELQAADGIALLLRNHLDWVVTQHAQARFLFEQVRSEWLTSVRADQESDNHRFRQAIERWRRPLAEAGQLHPLPLPVFISQLIGPAQILCRSWLAGTSADRPAVHARALTDCALRALVPAASHSDQKGNSQ